MMPELYRVPLPDIAGLAPELVLAGTGVLILLLEAFAPRLRRFSNPLALLAVLAAAWASWTWWSPLGASFHGLLVATPVTRLLNLAVLASGALGLLASASYLRRERLGSGEYYALFLWAMTGALLMTRATELVTLFVSLELLSICLYALAGYHRRLAVSTEAALKYFLMGAFVSAFVLLGIALVYGSVGATDLATVSGALAAPGAASRQLLLGLLLLVCGFAFKMSLAPFHAWAPDAYQGAASPFVAFLSVAPKVASAMVLVRLATVALKTAAIADWGALFGLLAVLSMVVGNVLALVQRDLKRMLAYSGVAHMGYLLVPLATFRPSSIEPLIVYLFAYALMNAGAFVVVGLLYAEPGEQHLISDLAGWGYRYPLLAFCLSVCMLSLGGIPPTFGFIGKYMVFVHAIETGSLGLAIAIVVTSLVGIFYYLRVVYTLYMRPEVREPSGLLLDVRGRLAALLAAGGTLLLGILPARLLEWVAAAGRALN